MLIYEKKDRIAALTLNRPERGNALCRRLRDELDLVLDDLDSDDDTRVLVVKSNGKNFCTGYDLTEWAYLWDTAETPSRPEDARPHRRAPIFSRREFHESRERWMRLWRIRQATIGVVRGACVAGGLDLAGVLDIVFTAEDATFGQPEARTMGEIHMFGMWPVHLGMRKTKEWLFTGDSMTGIEAAELGLANRAVPADEVEAVAMPTPSGSRMCRWRCCTRTRSPPTAGGTRWASRRRSPRPTTRTRWRSPGRPCRTSSGCSARRACAPPSRTATSRSRTTAPTGRPTRPRRRTAADVLPPVAERQAALQERFPEWVARRLDQMLDAAATEFGDRDLVVTDDRTWTYAEIVDRSTRLANGLVAAGVRPGEHVAMVCANFPEFVALKFAIARAGAVCVPVNFLNRRDELGYVLDQSDAVLLVTMDRFRDLDHLAALDALMPGWESGGGGERFPALRTVVLLPTGEVPVRPGATTVDDLAASEDGSAPVTATGPDDTADVLYTSGTTGTPKGVLLTHDMLLRTAYGSAYGRAFGDGRRITFSLPMYHVYGYVEGLLAVLFVGGAIVPQLAFSPAATLEAIGRHRCDDALFLPTMTAAVLDELDRAPRALPTLSSMISSGGVAPTGIWDRIDRHLPGVELTTGYGMSEVTASSTVTRPDDPPERRLTTNGRLRDVGVAGDPALGGRLVEYRVVDPVTRAEVPTGEVGELLARGPGVTSGYYRKPDETAAVFADGDGWLRTGDLGRLDADDYLTLVGRVKESYRCGGEQVMPKEVEDVLTGHPAVGQAHVVPLPDERMGEVGVAFVVPRPDAVIDPAELDAWCRERLARFKVPRHVLEIDPADIPTTPSGRPRKFLLAETAARQLSPPT